MHFSFIFLVSLTCFFLFVESEIYETNSLDFTVGIKNSVATFIDEDSGFLYFLDERDTIYLWKYNLYTLEIVDYMNVGIASAKTGGIDTVNKFLYVPTYYQGALLVKINLDTMKVTDQITLNVSYSNHAVKVEVDEVNQKAYVGYDYPDTIIKVDLASFTEEDALNIESSIFRGSLLDTANGILYTSSDGSTGSDSSIQKIDLSNFTIVDSFVVSLSGPEYLQFGVIDSSNQMLYFGTHQDPFRIVKINLATFSSVGQLTSSQSGFCYGAGIDVTNGFAYFLSVNGYLEKVNLGTFSIDDSFSFNGSYTYSIGFDSTGQSGYISLDDARVIQVDLPALTEGNKSEDIVYTKPEFILIDEVNQTGYIYFESLQGIIAKIDLGSFSIIDYLIIGPEYAVYHGEIDTANGFMYLFFNSDVLSVLKLDLSTFSIAESITVSTEGSSSYITFDSDTHFIYATFANDSDSNNYLLKISCPDLAIDQSVLFSNADTFYGLFLDSGHGYIYVWIKDNDEYGSGYLLPKIELSTFTQIALGNLTGHYMSFPVLDKSHQRLYFTIIGYSFAYFNLQDMQSIGNWMNHEFNSAYGSIIDPSDTFVFFVIDYYNADTQSTEYALIQIATLYNDLIIQLPFDSKLFSDYLYYVDISTSIGYILNQGTTPITLYQVKFTNPFTSSSQQFLFSFLVLAITLILGLF
ncbi:protein nirf [Anaeramoeba ignava]|uniref:Protein nirf n=1 Tax=Anaeramoeba ignava TaxID=1746090 RepID=A0A9Q0LI13_ANAIG|nr:protein nirf [Anaeramoeba ignava]